MNELLESLACSGAECLCWILVLFNIFAVFYLVFCSFWKLSKLSEICGWVYGGILICTTIIILFFHTCIYTLLATVFTGMMLMAILSVILPQQGEPRERIERKKAQRPMGAYVISETLDGWFVFSIYDAKRKHLARSTYAYDSIEKAKEEIAACRENGRIAETEDRSGLWIQEKYVPKFVICKDGERYGFSLRIVEGDSIIHSEKLAKLSTCLSLFEKVKANIDSPDIYMSVEKVSGEGYQKWGFVEEEPVVEEPIVEEPIVEEPIVEEPIVEEPIVEEPIVEEPIVEEPIVEEPIVEEPVVEEPVVEEPVVEEPVVEEPIVEEPAVEEPVVEEPIVAAPVPPKKCIVGVVWPENVNSSKVYHKIYRYKTNGEFVQVGDIVNAPTLDTSKGREIIRKAHVVGVEYYEEGDGTILPKKSIVSVER